MTLSWNRIGFGVIQKRDLSIVVLSDLVEWTGSFVVSHCERLSSL